MSIEDQKLIKGQVSDKIWDAKAFIRMAASKYWRECSGEKLAEAILAISEIKEALELWEKRDRLVELDEDQTNLWSGYGVMKQKDSLIRRVHLLTPTINKEG